MAASQRRNWKWGGANIEMGLIEKMKNAIRSWLNVEEANPTQIRITETMDYETNAIKNRIWYRGDGNELDQMHGQLQGTVDRYKFWASKPTPGMEIRKIHTGLPSMIVDTLTTVSLADMNDFEFKDEQSRQLWTEIEKDNKFDKKLEKAVKETLYIGDGAFKVSFDTSISQYPILEYYPGERIDIQYSRGRLDEITFKTVYEHKRRQYVLLEHYGLGYIKYRLTSNNKDVDITSIPQTSNLVDIKFGGYEADVSGATTARGSFMMAIPIQFFESGKWDGRGQSIFDRKIDSFDAFDEAWSQWMDALRAGRTKSYIPENYIPRNPNTGEPMKPNSFDMRFIKRDMDSREGATNKIETDQPIIPHDSYLSTYTTALDLCLQGLISPSTLGIDMKKLDNAEAQREKEKATLYSRNAIVQALQEVLPQIIDISIKAYQTSINQSIADTEVNTPFGEYANPSFESQVETVGKGKTQGIMSIEAVVEELYGDSKDRDWKDEEVKRLKNEQGIMTVDETSVAGLDGIKQEMDAINLQNKVGE